MNLHLFIFDEILARECIHDNYAKRYIVLIFSFILQQHKILKEGQAICSILEYHLCGRCYC